MQVRIHSPGSQERIKGYSTSNSFISRRVPSSCRYMWRCHRHYLQSGREQDLLSVCCLSIVCNCFVHHHSPILTLWDIFSKKSSKFSGCNLQSMITCNQCHHLAHICVQASSSMPFHVQMRQLLLLLLYQSFGTNDCTWTHYNDLKKQTKTWQENNPTKAMLFQDRISLSLLCAIHHI